MAPFATDRPPHGEVTDGGSVREGQIVGHNRWDLLEVPAIGAWEPSRRVSVVIPFYEAEEALRITLAALSAQTYPSELLQVVVADDGSDPPLELPSDLDGLDLVVVHQEDRGFGASRARNLGARTADGDILVFFDTDMVPEPWTVEAHARWHHASTHALTMGFRRHVEYGRHGPDDIRAALRDGSLGELFAGQEQQWPEWIDGHMARTNDLTDGHDDLFRIVAAGNLGLRKDLYLALGGYDESFTQWGAEDTEFGYRAFVGGAVLVPDREAMCWHQGFGHLPDPDERRSLEEQRAKIAHLIAHPGFRRARRGRSFTVPRVVVEVDTTGATAQEIDRTVTSVLANRVTDVVVSVTVDPELEGGVRLARELRADHRVTDGPVPGRASVPFELYIPAGAVVGVDGIDTLLRTMTDPEDPVGALRITVPDRSPAEASATMLSSRAAARARHAGAADDEVVEVVGQLFRTRWISGLDVPLTWHDVEGVPDPDPEATSAATELDELQGLWRSLRGMAPQQRSAVIGAAERVLALPPERRALLLRIGSRLSEALAASGALLRARRPMQVRRALGRLVAALLPPRVASRWRAVRSSR